MTEAPRPVESERDADPADAAPSLLGQRLAEGTFAVTAETTPGLTADGGSVVARVANLRGRVDAVNVTDGAGARAHMASWAAAVLLLEAGIEPVLQVTVRDRNRLALEADLLGAAALGVRNILCLRGDDVAVGDQPEAKMVYDLETRDLIRLACRMRDQAEIPSGRRIVAPPALFVGAAESPVIPDAHWSPEPIWAKVRAGADFFQTQFCFETEVARLYLSRLGDEGILERARFLIGVGALASAKSARWMNKNLWGVHVPDATIARLEAAADPKQEGIRICAEQISALQAVPGVAGVHVMGPGSETAAAQAIELSGVHKDRPPLGL